MVCVCSQVVFREQKKGASIKGSSSDSQNDNSDADNAGGATDEESGKVTFVDNANKLNRVGGNQPDIIGVPASKIGTRGEKIKPGQLKGKYYGDLGTGTEKTQSEEEEAALKWADSIS